MIWSLFPRISAKVVFEHLIIGHLITYFQSIFHLSKCLTIKAGPKLRYHQFVLNTLVNMNTLIAFTILVAAVAAASIPYSEIKLVQSESNMDDDGYHFE